MVPVYQYLKTDDWFYPRYDLLLNRLGELKKSTLNETSNKKITLFIKINTNNVMVEILKIVRHKHRVLHVGRVLKG